MLRDTDTFERSHVPGPLPFYRVLAQLNKVEREAARILAGAPAHGPAVPPIATPSAAAHGTIAPTCNPKPAPQVLPASPTNVTRVIRVRGGLIDVCT